jgi:hypothetical protein
VIVAPESPVEGLIIAFIEENGVPIQLRQEVKSEWYIKNISELHWKESLFL